MFNVHDLMEYRMQQQIAHEIYRQHIMQRIPDPFPQILSMGFPHPLMPPTPRPSLPGNVEAKLENNDLWQQFHKIGTEMIITKCGRRMFPSMRVSLQGLEEEAQYCVLLEMVPIGDCRYKFSGSQWVPAGGAEPQSPQRMFLHPDSPATGAHWQAQTILFNKVKLTNNTMDNSGHIVLASMHKYQPRLHIIKTTDLSQLPWAPQQNYVFPETEFVAVTAYQNDRITKLKIDNNPFAKGFRETGQSKCKRKMLPSASNSSSSSQHDESDDCQSKSEDDGSSVLSFESTTTIRTQAKRFRSSEPNEEEYLPFALAPAHEQFLQFQHKQQQQQRQPLQSSILNLPSVPFYDYYHPQTVASTQFMQQHLQTLIMEPLGLDLVACASQQTTQAALIEGPNINKHSALSDSSSISLASSPASTADSSSNSLPSTPSQPASQKRNNFSISAILAY